MFFLWDLWLMFDLGLMYLPFLLFSAVCLENKLFDNENGYIYHHMKIHLKICKNRKKFKLLLLTKILVAFAILGIVLIS